MHAHPFAFGGGLGIIAGPKFINDTALAELDGSFLFTFSNPPDLTLDGVLKMLSFQVAKAHLDFNFGGTLGLDLIARLPWWDDGQTPSAIRIDGEVNAWVDIPKMLFDAEGKVEACFGVCAGVDALASNIGAAGCLNFFGAKIGGAYTWADATIHFPIGCDLSPYRVPAPAAASATGERTVVVPPRQRLLALRLRGANGSPIVTISGPDGRRITTPTDRLGVKTGSYWLLRNPSDRTTGVVIARPASGRWRIRALPGSSPLAAVQEAFALPPVRMRARVSGKGRHWKLAYRIRPIAGQTVVFAEARGRNAHVIGTARGSSGTLRFTPGSGPAGRRPIFAIVLEQGLPRKQLQVASYKAPPPLRPGKPRHVRIRRSGTSVLVTWSRTSDTATYEVQALLPNHLRELFSVPARRRRLVIANVLPGQMRISVTALDRLGVRGSSGTAIGK